MTTESSFAGMFVTDPDDVEDSSISVSNITIPHTATDITLSGTHIPDWEGRLSKLTPDERKKLEDLDLKRKTEETKTLQRKTFAEFDAKTREQIIGAMDVVGKMNELENLRAEKSEQQVELERKQNPHMPAQWHPVNFPFPARTYEEGIGRLTKEELEQIHAQQCIEEELSDED